MMCKFIKHKHRNEGVTVYVFALVCVDVTLSIYKTNILHVDLTNL